MTERVDIGRGVFLEKRSIDGEFAGLGWWHVCNGAEREDFIPLRPAMMQGWDVIHVEPITIFPSVRCRRCGFHGYVTGGRWCPA